MLSSPITPLSSTFSTALSATSQTITIQPNPMVPDDSFLRTVYPETVEGMIMNESLQHEKLRCVIVGIYISAGVDKNRIVWRGPKGGLFFYNSINKRSLIIDSSSVKFDELLI